MVHVVASIGDFFAFLIRQGAWVMLELGLLATGAIGLAWGMLAIVRGGRSRLRRKRR